MTWAKRSGVCILAFYTAKGIGWLILAGVMGWSVVR